MSMKVAKSAEKSDSEGPSSKLEGGGLTATIPCYSTCFSYHFAPAFVCLQTRFCAIWSSMARPFSKGYGAIKVWVSTNRSLLHTPINLLYIYVRLQWAHIRLVFDMILGAQAFSAKRALWLSRNSLLCMLGTLCWHNEVLSDSLDLYTKAGRQGCQRTALLALKTMAQAPALWACKLPWPPIGWRLSKFVVASAIFREGPLQIGQGSIPWLPILVCGLQLKERLGVGAVFWQHWPHFTKCHSWHYSDRA